MLSYGQPIRIFYPFHAQKIKNWIITYWRQTHNPRNVQTILFRACTEVLLEII